MINSIVIAGSVNFIEKVPTRSGKTLTKFLLSVFAGKKDDKNQYSSIGVVCFDDIPLKEKGFYTIFGKLTGQVYTSKEGQVVRKIIIVANDVAETQPMFRTATRTQTSTQTPTSTSTPTPINQPTAEIKATQRTNDNVFVDSYDDEIPF